MSGTWGWIATITALLGGSGAQFVYGIVRDYRNEAPRPVRRQTIIDASIATVARARDELEEDVVRLRATQADERSVWLVERARYESDRAAWNNERVALRQEIQQLELALRRERAESTKRYDALLARVAELSARHAPLEGTT